MEFHSWLLDKKIKGLNISADIKIGDYAELAEKILEKNELQRKRVVAKGKPYVLLRRDILDGCVMPPIVLAVSESYKSKLNEIITQALEEDELTEELKKAVGESIDKAVSDAELLILDGLQRTYTIQQSINDAKESGRLGELNARCIRVEIYAGLSKTGILYRMLTLNTGQTPMSFRHQIEMLYHDYLDNENLPDGIKIYREVDEKRTRGRGVFKYSDVVDMFYAFSTGTAKSLDKQTLVTQLAELNFLESFSPKNDEMLELLKVYNSFLARIVVESGDWHATPKYLEDENVDRPFGTDVPSVFEKVQPMTAFGAECKRLLQQGQIESISDLNGLIDNIEFITNDPTESMDQLVVIIDQAGKTASKIGPAQREIFQFSFRALFNENSDSYLDLSGCWLEGQSRHKSLDM